MGGRDCSLRSPIPPPHGRRDRDHLDLAGRVTGNSGGSLGEGSIAEQNRLRCRNKGQGTLTDILGQLAFLRPAIGEAISYGIDEQGSRGNGGMETGKLTLIISEVGGNMLDIKIPRPPVEQSKQFVP